MSEPLDLNLKFPPQSRAEFIALQILAPLWACVIFLVDIGMDANVAYVHYHDRAEKGRGSYWYFSLTLLFTIIPSLTMTVVCARWYRNREPEIKVGLGRGILRGFCLIFQLTPALQWAETLRYGWKMRKARQAEDKVREEKYYWALVKSEKIASTLDVIEGFMESAPQVILQCYILSKNFFTQDFDAALEGHLDPATIAERKKWRQDFNTQLGLSIGLSIMSFAWSVTSYENALRAAREQVPTNASIGRIVFCVLFQFLWHMCMLLSRLFAVFIPGVRNQVYNDGWPYLNEITHLGGALVLVLCLLHLALTLFWLFKWKERAELKNEDLNRPILALVYVFTFFNQFKGRSRWDYVLYYLLFFVENILSVLIVARLASSDNFQKSGLAAAFLPSTICFVLGIFFMLGFYGWFHPYSPRFGRDPTMVQRRTEQQNYSMQIRTSASPVV